MDDFSKPKIVWGNLSLNAAFSEAPAGMYVNAPCPMIVPFDWYLLAVLNSKLGDWYIRRLGVTRNGGYFEYKPMFIEKLPVPRITTYKERQIFVELSENPSNHNQHILDKFIFQLYGLTKEESMFIEKEQQFMNST